MKATRRTVLKTIAAALTVPSWLIKPVKRRTIDLMQFCSPEEYARYELRLPFVQGEWTYATDGRVCVRVEPESGDQREAEKKLPPADDLPWWSHDSKAGWKALPNVEPLLAKNCQCPTCDGEGFLGALQECDECEADGMILVADEADDPDDWELIECQKCCGRGRWSALPCGMCQGHGYGTFPGLVPIAGEYIAAKYYRRLQGLGEVEYRVSTSNVAGHKEPPNIVQFRFDGGLGLLMPIEREHAKEELVS